MDAATHREEEAMGKQMSFTGLEREYVPRLRSLINRAEDRVDLENHFCNTVADMLNRIFAAHRLKIGPEDVRFNPGAAERYSVSRRLFEYEPFRAMWENSNLKHVIEGFARSAYRRYMHLDRHPEKTEKKIRN
jgi:hypothetical protein